MFQKEKDTQNKLRTQQTKKNKINKNKQTNKQTYTRKTLKKKTHKQRKLILFSPFQSITTNQIHYNANNATNTNNQSKQSQTITNKLF